MSQQNSAQHTDLSETGRGCRRRIDPKYARILLPAVMAAAMSLVMSLVDTVVRLGWAANLVSAWLGSFAVGVVVAVPTAILFAPTAHRLVGRLTDGQRADRDRVTLPGRAWARATGRRPQASSIHPIR